MKQTNHIGRYTGNESTLSRVNWVISVDGENFLVTKRGYNQAVRKSAPARFISRYVNQWIDLAGRSYTCLNLSTI